MHLPEIQGRATLPGDAAWDEARRCWNLAVDQRPAAVVEAASVADIKALLRAGLRVAPQSTGHGAELLGDLDGVVLLKTGGLKELAVIAGGDGAGGGALDGGGGRRAGAILRAGAGVLAGEAADAAAAHGLAPVLGLAEGVGVVGLVLGGGTGWLSRAHGLACSNVRAFDVVLASGETERVTGGDLFWALRGGGGRGAVVTAVELEAHPVEVSAGLLMYPFERAGDVLEQFARWTADAPEALGAVLRVVVTPNGPLLMIGAAFLGTAADARRCLEPVRVSTVDDTFAPVDPARLVRVAGDPTEPLPTAGDGFLLRELDVEAIAGVLEDLGPIGLVEVRLLGGALAREPRDPGAVAKLDAPYSLFAGGVAAPELREARDALRTRMAPWIAPQELLSSAARGVDPAKAVDWARLRRVQEAYDPEHRIVVTHE